MADDTGVARLLAPSLNERVKQPPGNPYTELLLTERGFSYAKYLRSPEWARKRKGALERADHRCQVCNSPHELQAHHRTYERICKEDHGDLTVLCATCHTLFHAGGRILGLYVEDEAVA
jgi:hypothetical protein